MGLALLAFSEPDPYPSGSARALYREITEDMDLLAEYRVAFDPAPTTEGSFTTRFYKGAKKQLKELQKQARTLSMNYRRYPRRTYKVLLRDKKLKPLWKDLCEMLNALLDQLDETNKTNYRRTAIWRRLDDVIIVYEEIEPVLKGIIDRENLARSKGSPG